MSFLVKAYRELILFDLILTWGSFDDVYRKVRECPIDCQVSQADVVEGICSAIDMACIWYRKEVLCLQRSAATTCLLRRHGVNARMVIGAQQVPFKAHAWVEVGDRIVNDKPYVAEMYAVLDRC